MTTKLIDIKNLKNFIIQGPWGDQNGGNHNGGQNGGPNAGQNTNPKPQNTQPTDKANNRQEPEDFLEKVEKFLENLLGNKTGGPKGPNNKPGNGPKKTQTPKSLIGLIILALVFLWLSSGIYKVNSDENAVVLYFGKFYSIETPGLNYHIPFPFGKVIKQSVTTVNTEEFGFASNSNTNIARRSNEENLMLTGDENIVDIEFQVQWQIANIEDYVFNIANPNNAIRKTAQSAMREIIARTPIASALSDGKRNIESETKNLLQQVLDYYGAGVRIVLVQLRRVDPPSQVIDAFRDVQTAKADKEKEINQAQSYSNNIIPRARGEASQMEQESEAYRQEVVAIAQGEAGRFTAVYRQYAKAKRVTKKRMYLETMEKIYRDMDKVFIDKNASKAGVIPYFPLNDMPKQTK